MESEAQQKEIIRLKTIVEGQKKLLDFQEPVYQGDSADQFFMERIDDLVQIEEMIQSSEEKREAIDQEEMAKIILRLNQQSGPYGHKRKQLIDKLFTSIIEMALPGFIEYLFYGNEQRDLNETGFFHK